MFQDTIWSLVSTKAYLKLLGVLAALFPLILYDPKDHLIPYSKSLNRNINRSTKITAPIVVTRLARYFKQLSRSLARVPEDASEEIIYFLLEKTFPWS